MSKIDTTGDLVLIRTISEDAIVSSLQSRYKSDKIYTYIGTGKRRRGILAPPTSPNPSPPPSLPKAKYSSA